MICIPIVSLGNKALKDIKLALRLADIIELRLDLIKPSEELLEKLIKLTKKPIIVTNRKKGEGGNAIENKARIGLLKKAIELKADYIDIELSSGEGTIKDLIRNKKKTKVIISYHNFKQTPKNLEAIYKKIKSHKPDIIKIVTHANSINDNIKILNLIKKAKKQNKKIIALCMGGKGEISRILSPLIGAQLTFASLNKERESAPGQLTAEALIKTYNICKLKSPKIYGLVGNPVSHSKGIIVHNKNFGKLKQNKIYVNFLVSNIKEFIKNYREIISGLSITIPHKKTIMPYLNKIEPTAKKIGAVNTVIKKNNKLIGYNTDYVGAIKAIKEKTAIKNKNVLIIGAGGVSKAIAYGVKKERGQIIITNRTVSKATALAKQISCKSININQIKNLKGIDILINATSIGMKSKKAPITKQILKKITVSSSVVFDSVYTPPITQLLKDAKSLKLKTISGEKMFTYQAQEQFKLFN